MKYVVITKTAKDLKRRRGYQKYLPEDYPLEMYEVECEGDEGFACHPDHRVMTEIEYKLTKVDFWDLEYDKAKAKAARPWYRKATDKIRGNK